jgi:hypothetical protein
LTLYGDQPYREITMPTVAEATALFAQPQKEYSAIHWAIWGGQQSKERIISDIEKIYENGGGVYMINNSRGVKPAVSLARIYGLGEDRRSGMQETRHESLD